MKTETKKNLFERLGGALALDVAVDIFYQKVLTDENLKRLFTHVDMNYLKAKQKAFLCMVLGGPVKYTGKDMRSAHAHLIEKGLNENHFDAVVMHLQNTLEQLKVESSDILEVKRIAESVRNDVLNR